MFNFTGVTINLTNNKATTVEIINLDEREVIGDVPVLSLEPSM